MADGGFNTFWDETPDDGLGDLGAELFDALDADNVPAVESQAEEAVETETVEEAVEDEAVESDSQPAE